MNNPINTYLCDLCLLDNMEKYEHDYINKKYPVSELVDMIAKNENIKCSVSKFYRHMRYHVRPEMQVMLSKSAPVIANEMIDKMGELISEIDRIKDKIEIFHEKLTGDSDPALIRAYIGLEEELRKTVETLAKLSGDIKSSDKIYVKNLTVEYNNVIGQVLQDACPVCKSKFVKTLEPLIMKNAKDDIRSNV